MLKPLPLKSCKGLWFPISELTDIHEQRIMIASPRLIDLDSNPEGVSTAYWQDGEGWIVVGWDMCNDEPIRNVIATEDVTHFMYVEGPYNITTASLNSLINHSSKDGNMSELITTSYNLNGENRVEKICFVCGENTCVARLNEDNTTYSYHSQLQGDKEEVHAPHPMSLADCILAAHIHLSVIPPQNFDSIPCDNSH